MAGFDNDCMYADNADFSTAGAGGGSATNGLQTNGQIWTGTTAVNAGGTHINVGAIISPLGTLSIGYSSPNITIDAIGGTTAVDSFAMQTGTSPVLPAANGLVTFNGAVVAAGTNPVRTDGTGANTMALEVQTSQALAAADATKIGLSNFDSTSFSVTATGFVSLIGGGFTWNDVSGAFSPLKENGYFITGTATGTLPASPVQGDTIKFFVDHATQLLTIDAPGTQIIRLGSLVTSAGGTAVSTLQGDSVELVYRASDTCWCAIAGFTGTWTLA